MDGAKILLSAAMLGIAAGTAHAADWVDIKDPAELRALYSDKTHRSRAFVSYFRADGQGIYVAQGSDTRVPRTWRVKGNDQVCVGPKGGDPLCFRYQRNAKNPAEVLAVGESRGQRVMLWFTVEDGIPKF
jgi:hypothetical protein